MDKLESYIDGKIVYISTKFLAAINNVTPRNVSQWVKQGMPVYKMANIKSNLFILNEAQNWIDTTVNKSKSNNARGLESNDKDLEDEEKMFEIYTKGNAQQKRKLLLRLDQNRLDNFKKIEEIVEKEAKNKEYDSKYALIDKVKKGQQELASMFISLLKTSMAVLSKDLENKEQDEIYHLLDRHFKKEIDKLQRYIRREEEVAVSFDEVISVMIEIVNDKDIDHDTIVKHLGKL